MYLPGECAELMNGAKGEAMAKSLAKSSDLKILARERELQATAAEYVKKMAGGK